MNTVLLTAELGLETLSDVSALGYLGFLAVMSLVTFIAYAVDKKKAIDGEWRTKEKTLLGLSLFGGAIGGFLAMKFIRHKTKHWYFWAVNIVGMLIHAALFIYVIG